MSRIQTEEGIIRAAFPKITDSTYINRLLSVMRKSNKNGLEAALQYLLSFAEHPEKFPPYISPFEVMSGPGVQLTRYHHEARLKLLSSFPRIPEHIIQRSFEKNRHLYILTCLELQKGQGSGTFTYEGTKYTQESEERKIDCQVTDPHLQSDIAKVGKEQDLLKEWMDLMKTQTSLDDVYPPLPEEPSFLFSVPHGTVRAACAKCSRLFPVAELAECHNGHPICRACFSTQVSADPNNAHCPHCNLPYTHAVLSAFLTKEQKYRLRRPARTQCSCDYPDDTIKSGICYKCFFPLVPGDEAHVWKCDNEDCGKDGGFYLV